MRTLGLVLVFSSMALTADALTLYDPKLCFILDGFLGLYGLFITAMFLREKFFRQKVKEDSTYSVLQGQGSEGYDFLRPDPEQGHRTNRRNEESTYTGLAPRTDGEYKELPIRRERQRKNEQVYQGLSSATRDTYDSLQMQQFPSR